MTLVNKRDREWANWIWQQQHAVRDVRDLKHYFTNVPGSFFDRLHNDRLKFQVTPYLLSQIPEDITQDKLERDPFFLQFFPLGQLYTEGHDSYDGTDNWEKSEERPTKNLQHKYTNRVVVRFRQCFGYCNFCFESLGTLEKRPSDDKLFLWGDWEKSLDYIRTHPEIEEVILTGGEPLLVSNIRLEQILSDLSSMKNSDGASKVKFKRIHTRVMTFNPYRVDDKLIELIKDYSVNEIALNVAHPLEITSEFEDAVGKIREGTGKNMPLLVAHTPLLKGVNDDTEILWELFSKLYSLNVKPYYLLHSMPHVPYADQQRVSVRGGVRLLKPLWRTKSHIALPEYVIVHYDGKHTVPLELNGTPEFRYTKDGFLGIFGNPIVKFLNWKCNWVEYPDVNDPRKD